MKKLRQYLCLGAFSTVIRESSVPTNQYFLAFFLSDLQIVQVWFWNYKSYFGHFQICGQCLYYRIFRTVLYIKINFDWWPFLSYFFLVNISWMSHYFRYLNYAKYFRHVQKIKHCLCLKPFSVIIYGKFNYNYFLYF